MRLFFFSLLTRFSAILLLATEGRTHVSYYPLERTKRSIPINGNGLVVIWLCMLSVSQTVSFGGFGMVDILSESLFMAVLRGLRAAGAVPLAGAALFI